MLIQQTKASTEDRHISFSSLRCEMHLLSLTRKLRRKEKRGKAVSILLAPQTPNVDQSAECRRLCFPLNEYKKRKKRVLLLKTALEEDQGRHQITLREGQKTIRYFQSTLYLPVD